MTASNQAHLQYRLRLRRALPVLDERPKARVILHTTHFCISVVRELAACLMIDTACCDAGKAIDGLVWAKIATHCILDTASATTSIQAKRAALK